MYKKKFVLLGCQKVQNLVSYRTFVVMLLVMVSLASGCSYPRVNPDGGDQKRTAEEKIRQGIVEAARSKIGVKYKLGGTNPKTGFDCSGLVLWSYLQYGIHVPRTAAQQMKAGVAVTRNNLQPADILVFKIVQRRKARYHTGIYAGNGMFIHSPRTGKKIYQAKLSSPYWSKRFVTARRIAVLK